MAKKPLEPEDPHPNAKPIGIFMLGFCLFGFAEIGSGLRGYLKTEDEVKTTARITFYRSGARSPTLRYEYTWKGQHFRGKEIGLLGYHKGAEQRVRSAYKSGEPIEVFIDPSDPSYSVVDRTWNWDKFSFHSLWAIGWGAGAAYNLRLAARRKKRRPDDSRQIRRAEKRKTEKESQRKNMR